MVEMDTSYSNFDGEFRTCDARVSNVVVKARLLSVVHLIVCLIGLAAFADLLLDPHPPVFCGVLF